MENDGSKNLKIFNVFVFSLTKAVTLLFVDPNKLCLTFLFGYFSDEPFSPKKRLEEDCVSRGILPFLCKVEKDMLSL